MLNNAENSERMIFWKKIELKHSRYILMSSLEASIIDKLIKSMTIRFLLFIILTGMMLGVTTCLFIVKALLEVEVGSLFILIAMLIESLRCKMLITDLKLVRDSIPENVREFLLCVFYKDEKLKDEIENVISLIVKRKLETWERYGISFFPLGSFHVLFEVLFACGLILISLRLLFLNLLSFLILGGLLFYFLSSIIASIVELARFLRVVKF